MGARGRGQGPIFRIDVRHFTNNILGYLPMLLKYRKILSFIPVLKRAIESSVHCWNSNSIRKQDTILLSGMIKHVFPRLVHGIEILSVV